MGVMLVLSKRGKRIIGAFRTSVEDIWNYSGLPFW
jgi:hypothetical protein